MNLYISLKWLEEHIEVVSYEGMWHETETDEFVSVKNIHSAPSIDIVRCKECKRRYRSGYRGDEYWVCDFMDAKIKDDDFCSYGERREP